MNDVLPEAIARWHRVERAFREISTRYGYTEVRTPIVEPTQLFVRSIGETTDIVEKEMYTFVDKGDDMLTLRPEGTASAVRAYVEHAVNGREPISKWSYVGPMFRRERPARGRYRQFWQAGVECFGDAGPFVDAEMIDMVVTMLASLGVQDLEVLVNSLGSGETRAKYKDALTAYLSPHRDRLSEDSQRRLGTNPLRILDSKSEGDKEICAGAPSLLEFLDDADRTHFEELQKSLDALGTRYRVEPKLVRGLDYYSRTLFEVQGRGGELGAQNTICGGGRYDGLVKELGGPDVPSIGFAAGIERILLVMGGEDRAPTIDVAVAVADAALRVDASVLLRDLRAAGLVADGDLRGQSLKSQLRRADKLGAKVVLVLGPAETERGVVQMKDLAAHSSNEVPRAEVVARVRDRVRESA
ncbi:histidine--tRNA ligase [Sandaracinus amylolyticus]|uniref:histidine--tRNA ligase n=1 Tax=Sandaracinus amylolyticus TaxID=927083 RepID=UPI001F01409D|nr:histidine--tRNA ligase [Sandaracinus amylolyticus]